MIAVAGRSVRGCRHPFVNNTPPVSPVVFEDFSTYTNTANLLADPRSIYDPFGANTDRVALDTAVGYGDSTKSMRYDWPVVNQEDYVIAPGWLAIPGDLTHMWLEAVVRFSSGFDVTGPASGAAEYKLLLFGGYDGTERWGINFQEGQWVIGYPGNLSGFTPNSPVPSSLWDEEPHVLHVEARISPSGNAGIFRVACDDEMMVNTTGYNDNGTHSAFDFVRPGANMNKGSDEAMSSWWLRLAAYDENPSWTGFP